MAQTVETLIRIWNCWPRVGEIEARAAADITTAMPIMIRAGGRPSASAANRPGNRCWLAPARAVSATTRIQPFRVPQVLMRAQAATIEAATGPTALATARAKGAVEAASSRAGARPMTTIEAAI